MQQFLEFIDRKQREGKKHLKLIERLLRKNNIQVYSHLENEEQPFIFVKSNDKLSFDGIRIYEIGEMIAYRIQRQEQTEPFGKAYLLDVEDMFNDYMSENIQEEEAGKLVIKSICDEITKFFQQSKKAEAEIKTDYNKPTLIVKAGSGDYASSILNNV